jgi:hypothetical protein
MKFPVKRLALVIACIGVLYFSLFNHTPRGTDCENSKSPDGVYMAELCLLRWVPGGNSKFVGRLFDAKTGKLLAEHTFSTPVPQLSWSSGLYYSNTNSPDARDIGPSVQFSRGDAAKGDSAISLPPSKWDQLLAARPRL